MTTPIISTISYDPATGEQLQSLTSLTFGQLAPKEKSTIKVVRLQIAGIEKLLNVQLGIVGASFQGTSVNKICMVGTSVDFIPNYQPSGFFPGINAKKKLNDVNNINVGFDITGLQSQFVYLAVKCPDKYLGSGECVYRWFFDFLP